MAKSNRKLSPVYPEERENKTKDANKKLKSQIRSLKKMVKQLESKVKTLSRSFDKSCDFIQHKLDTRSLEEVLNMIDNFEYKETEKGRKVIIQNKKTEFSDFSEQCPDCSSNTTNGFKIFNFKSRGFSLKTCTCGYRSKVDNEGSERS